MRLIFEALQDPVRWPLGVVGFLILIFIWRHMNRVHALIDREAEKRSKGSEHGDA